jgi:hypothetical protein
MRIRKDVPIQVLADLIDGIGTAHRNIDRRLSDDLRYVATLLEQIPHALPTEGICPYCRLTYLVNHYRPELRGTSQVVAGRMRVVEWLCNRSEEYAAGYRARWRCNVCGEEEVR